MQPEADKKIFSVNGTEYTLVKGKRWYVEYIPTVRVNLRGTVRAYGQLNREKDLEKREALVPELIKKIAGAVAIVSVLDAALKDHKADYRLKTYQSYGSRVKYYLEWLDGAPESTVTPGEAGQFLRYLKTIGKAPATAASYQRTLSSLYTKAGLNNPFKGLKPRLVQSKGLMYFRDSQMELILAAARYAKPDLYLAILLQYYCFIRPGELRLLETDDFNLQDGYIEIRAEVSKNKKTQKVVIPDALLPELASYYRFETRGLLFYNDWMKDKEGPDMPVGKNYFNRHHSAILKALKIKGRYAFYSWKPTGVVKAVKAGIHIKDLQLQLRHYSLDQVNEYLKDLGVLDSQDLRSRFPALPAVPAALPRTLPGAGAYLLASPAPFAAIRYRADT